MNRLSDDLERYAEPQRRFEALRERTLLRLGPDVCDLAYANSHDGPMPAAIAAMRRALDAPRELDLQYSPYGGATITRRLVARNLGAFRGAPVGWRHVVMTPGAMAALNVVFRSVRHEGEDNEVVLVTPCWLDYPLYLANLGIRPRFAPVEPGTLRLDVDAIARAINRATRAVVLSQPANPSGLVYTDAELQELARVLTDRGSPLLVADECHRDIVFESARFASPAEHYDATCIVHSFGKTWLIQGQRIGYAAVSPRHPDALRFAERLALFCRIMGYATPTALMQLAVRELVGRHPDFEPIARRRAAAIALLREAGYRITPSQATFFLYPEVPEGQDDEAFCDRLAARGALVLPAAMFHHEGHFRISLTATDRETARGLEIIAEALVQGEAA
jgi:aspartate aminotransferase